MSEITIRRAVHTDIPFLIESNQAMATETEDLGLNIQALGKGIAYLMTHAAEGFYLIAEQNRISIGTLMVTFEWSDWRNGRFWWIQSVFVPITHRRKGVYNLMHNAVRQLALQDPQACGIRLYVEHNNQPAIGTYLKMGMAETHYRLYEEPLKRPD
ncbi:MAG: GNAT family N-acetyltransferase [Gammaproteobacteria bacterium]|nr:GNAT family N-acetyltransferase [Gammaproteobacteria bacterium]